MGKVGNGVKRDNMEIKQDNLPEVSYSSSLLIADAP